MTASLSITETARHIFAVDLYYNGIPEHSSAYIIKDRQSAIIETGTGHGSAHILAALKALGMPEKSIRYVIVTHVHLDHAGGAGMIVRELPDAELIVHHRGAKHLIDPEKLTASAREVYGTRFDTLFGELIPIPGEKVIRCQDTMRLELGERNLEIFPAHGHAYHHIMLYSPADRGIFSGDAGGLLFPPFRKKGFEYTLISTSPTQFDPLQMKKTLNFMESLSPEKLFYTHCGKTEQAAVNLRRAGELVDAYVAMVEKAAEEGGDFSYLYNLVRSFHLRELAEKAITAHDPLFLLLDNDLELNAQGLFHYLKKQEKEKAALS
jgi:glyoxylase-like metal-dependent hydrolase (beta-lactamase superfamily II)